MCASAGKVISEAYELEYGEDCLEMHVGAVQQGEKSVVIDDLVATGGTLSAAIKLLGTTTIYIFDDDDDDDQTLLKQNLLCFTFTNIIDMCLFLFCCFKKQKKECMGSEVVECACVIGVPELIKVMHVRLLY